MPIHKLMGGDLQIFQRGRSRFWQCSASIGGKQYRHSTKEESLTHAKQLAEDWYLGMRGKSRAGLLKTEKTFAEASKQFLKEYEIITEGQRSPRWAEGHKSRVRLHLDPYFGEIGLSEITAGKVQEYRMHRATTPPDYQPMPGPMGRNAVTRKPKTAADYQSPSRSTLHNEIVTIRLVLKTALRHGWLAHLPDLSPPYRTQGKIVHRPWFSPEEYKQLYEATRDYARTPLNEHYRWDAEQLHDFVLFMGNTGLRPDEAKNLQFRDVSIVTDDATRQKILEIDVRGKRGVGYCKSLPGAVRPFERLLARAKPSRTAQTRRARRMRGETGEAPPVEVRLPEPTDRLFPSNYTKSFSRLLERTKLRFDRDNKPRVAYSLRHTYICMRLMEGADIYQIAKNCRTSVEMIEKFYAAHIKNTLDAAAINVRRPRTARRTGKAAADGDGAEA